MKAIEEIGYPAVLKPVVGSWGRLSALIKDRDMASAILEDREQMFPLYRVYYLQEFVKRPPRDIRSFVIGGETVAAIYRTSEGGDWRTNTARGGKASNCKITQELAELSARAAEVVGGEIVGAALMEGAEVSAFHEGNKRQEFRTTSPPPAVT